MATINRKLPHGNCAFCDGERGVPSAWGMAPEGWARMKDDHDAGHPNWEKNQQEVEKGFEKMLTDMEEKSKKKIENKEDDGHLLLLADIKALQLNAEDGEYHDFINKKFPAPKISLVEHLRDMMDKAMNGAYDN